MPAKYAEEAKELLKSGNIIKQIIKDTETLGYIGEDDNKILGYLITLSRKLQEPLSGIVSSSSGAGKSKLVEILQSLAPKDEVVFTSRLTAQSLYYMPKDFLKNKLLIIEERIGSELADYAIRSLQSKGCLSLAVPLKNQTVFFEVEGPVSVLETTTSFRINSENASRCFILYLDESRKQTERIQAYQRKVKTYKGIDSAKLTEKVINFHRALQKSIASYPIIIPYAEKLTFPSQNPASRRGNQKLLTLIEAVTLLHQYQREKVTRKGITYLVSSIKDYEIAHRLFKHSYDRTSVTSHPKAGLLLNCISSMQKEVFTRKDIASFSSWPDYAVRDNIRYLEDAGLVEIIQKEKGKEVIYRLNGNFNLTEPESLEE